MGRKGIRDKAQGQFSLWIDMSEHWIEYLGGGDQTSSSYPLCFEVAKEQLDFTFWVRELA